jgi:sulfate/thiosulfate transport system substrate-binding protein
VDKHGTRKVGEAYLQYLYTDEGQDIIAKNYYRPTVEKAAKKYAAQFPKVKLFTIGEVDGDWTSAQKNHFADGGIFDQIYQPSKKIGSRRPPNSRRIDEHPFACRQPIATVAVHASAASCR